MKTNEIVIFRKRKEPCCGIFLSSDGGTVTVFSEEGRNMSVAEGKVAFVTGMEVDKNSSDHERKMEMRKLRRELEDSKKDFDLKTLWECFADKPETVSFGDILSVHSAGAEISPKETLKLFWAVDKDTVYFKREPDGYIPLSADCVRQTLSRLKRQNERHKQEQFSVEWIKSVLRGVPAEPEGFDREGCVKSVMAYIENREDVPAFRDAQTVLSKSGIHDPETAAQFLVKTGDLPEGSDPAMIRAGIGKQFSERALAESSQLLSDSALPDFLEDMTGLETFSIDDETTEDIDDAISFEISEHKARVGIHIANVALCVPPDGELDREAFAAAETVYLPELRADIFPGDFVTGRLSLLERTVRAALSILITFDPETLEMNDFRFSASKISVNRNMSYDEAERLFETSPGWNKLAEICDLLRRKRVERGAFTVQIPELKIKTDVTGKIEVGVVNAEGVSRRVVSELMITANHLSAVFLRDRGVPAIFRSQPEPVSVAAKTLDADDPLFPVRVVKFLKPSVTGVVPKWHRSLGVECYAQATSPIRRYRDLLVQRQIMSEIRGEAGFDENTVLRIISDTEQNIHARKIAQRSRIRFWLFEHFKRMGKNTKLRATVSRIADGRAFVYLPSYVSEFPLHSWEDNSLKEGQTLTVKIRKVDPLRRKLRLVPAV